MKEGSYTEQVTMSIGVVQRITGINANTLRMWERRYELGPSQRGSGGQREYTKTDIDHLSLIKKLIDKGMRIGDIAQLPTKTLTSLLLESGDTSVHTNGLMTLLQTQIVGINLSYYFKSHIKRYPALAIECANENAENWLDRIGRDGLNLECKDLLILEQHSLNKRHIDPLIKISQQKLHVIVLYLYSNHSVLDVLQKEGIILLSGNIESLRIDEAVNRVLDLSANLSVLDQACKAFDVTLPKTQPRQFSEAMLIEAEASSDKLNCECPPHITDLIRRLNAFEQYSQTCGAENWKQAAVHACVYSYANQARYLMEKALRAVLEE